MNRTFAAAALLALATLPARAAGPGETSGTWLTEDGRARIRMERCGAANDRLCGYVVWLKEPNGADGKPKVDQYNPDASKRARPSLGTQLLKGLPVNEDGRFAGQIYNGDNGKSYDVTIWSESPAELNVRGCLMSYLCKTQGWKRVSDVVPGQLAGLTGAPNGPRPEPGYGKPLQMTGAVSAKAARKAQAAPAQPAPAAAPAAAEERPED